MWVLGNIQRTIREPHCANLMHSDLDSVNPPGLDQLEPLPIVPPHERLAHEQG